MASRLMKPIRWLLQDSPEQRSAVTGPDVWGSSWDEMGPRTSSGVRVTQENALAIEALFSGTLLIADTCAMLPIDNFVKSGDYRLPAPSRPVWLDEPDPDGLIWHSFVQQWVVSKIISHGACVRILRNDRGSVIALKVLDPRLVEPQRDARDRVVYVYAGGRSIIQAEDMIYDSTLIKPGHVKGTSRVDELRETYGIARALDEFSARFFGQGSTSIGVIEHPGEGTPEQAKAVKDGWEDGHRGLANAHRPGVIFGGGHWVKTGVDPEQAQMLESKHFSVESVARTLRIHPSMLGVIQPGTQAYASREQDAIQYTTFTITASYLTPMEQHLRRLLPRNEFPKFTTGALLRAALADRYAAYSTGIQGGFLTINQINALEDRPPVDGGDEYRVPLANINLSAAGVAELKERVAMLATLVGNGFDPASAATAVGLPEIAVTQPTDSGGQSRELSLVEMVQKVYLGVGVVISKDEARQMLNDAGANLAIPGPTLPSDSSGGTAG